MLSPEYKFEALIRESMIDSFGHLHNTEYAQLMEDARWDFITANGYGSSVIQVKKLAPVIMTMEITFLREVLNRDTVTIRSTFTSFNGKFAALEQKMSNRKNELCAIGVFTFGMFDLNLRKMVDPTPEWIAGMGIDSSKVAAAIRS